MRQLLCCIAAFLCFTSVFAQTGPFTHADSLRGRQSSERIWWNVLKYDINATFDSETKSLVGSNTITYQNATTKIDGSPLTFANAVMQIDLMEPLVIDSIKINTEKLPFTRDGNAWFTSPDVSSTNSGAPDVAMAKSGVRKITVWYHGNPPIAVNPPWDGGAIFTTDKNNNPWISVACQGFGASSWFPNKDQLPDEPDSVEVHITAPDNLVAVSNGKLTGKSPAKPGFTTWSWEVRNPINSYNIIPYIGKYQEYSEIYKGALGNLDVSYWVLDYNLPKAIDHMRPDVLRTLKHLEYWFGPYPFYEDGFKMVESPHLGMEHQSAVAYGNGYQNGYRGRDLSGTGWGLKWDFIVVHESAHEWFGNSITTKDRADMWVHEAFGTYAEVLFIESEYGKAAGAEYVIGRRSTIENDVPIIPPYGVNAEGSGDMYTKGANMLHIIRQIIGSDDKFRDMLHELNNKFYHKTIDGKDVQDLIQTYTTTDLSKIFDQYLKTIDVPVLSYSGLRDGKNFLIKFKWENCVAGFNMPVRITLSGKSVWINPTTKYQTLKLKGDVKGTLVDKDFYVGEKKL